MDTYTENVDEILEKQKACVSRKKSNEKQDVELFDDSEPDEEDDTMSEDVKIWAAGCLYLCEICDSDHAGAIAFKSHLTRKHRTSFTRHVAKYQLRNVCVSKGYVFCKLCCKNIIHDTDDLKKHFDKEHQISINEYYDRFKAKLKQPRMERPEAFKPTSSKQEHKKSSELSLKKDLSDSSTSEGTPSRARKRLLSSEDKDSQLVNPQKKIKDEK